MSSTNEKINTAGLLVTKVINDIAKSPLIEDENKIKALNGIIKMIKDDEYAKEVKFEFDQLPNWIDTPLGEFVCWNDTDEGHGFWSKLDDILYG